jgi:hypothetical protein
VFSLPAIAALVDEGGDISIGPVGELPCVATATGYDQCIAMLLRRDNESFVQLLLRLDAAIGAFSDDGPIDEINPPPISKKKPTTRR